MARNNDLPPYLREGSKSEIYAPKNGNRFNITTSSFINGEEGVNEHGFAVAMTFVMTDLEKIKAGFNSCFIVRYLLEKADNTEQAVSLLMGLPVSSNCNILLADGYLEALKQYQKQKYDLFLLDINLPDGNGLEFCEKIRETSETPVLFLTANDTEEDMLEGFGVGCDDYISKPFSIEVLRKKVLAVLKRSGVGKFRMKYRDLELDKEKCLVLMKGQEIHLTSTEYKLLLYLMENRGRVVTKAMLLEQLWDIDGNFVDDNTVRVNIKRLRQKLNDEKQEYIVTVFGMGYSFGE